MWVPGRQQEQREAYGAAHEAEAEGDHASEHLSINVFHACSRNMELSPEENLFSKRGAVTAQC